MQRSPATVGGGIAASELELGLAAFAAQHGLSGQQHRMLVLLLARLSNKQIAERLGIAESSVRVQWGRVVRKLGDASGTTAREGVLVEVAAFCLRRCKQRDDMTSCLGARESVLTMPPTRAEACLHPGG